VADDLSRAFLGSGPAGYGVSTVMGAVLTEWNYPGPDPANPDYGNVVTDGAYTFTNCLVLHPSLLVVGRVALIKTDAGMMILGNSYQKPPPVIPTDPV
jgi:hypothetical protein